MCVCGGGGGGGGGGVSECLFICACMYTSIYISAGTHLGILLATLTH